MSRRRTKSRRRSLGKAPRLNDLLTPKAQAKARDGKQGTIWPVAAANGTAEMRRLQPHPAADLFPMLSDAELDEFAADIKSKGQLEPITVTPEGLILDGRNRYEACRRAGVSPKCEEWHVAGSPTAWVLSRNLHRRHLTTDQRALIALEAEAMFAAEAKQRMQAGGGDRKSEKAKADRVAPRGATRSRPETEPKKGKAAEQAAHATGASARQVERAKRLQNQRPELLPRVKSGELTLKQAEKQLVKEQRTKEVLEYRPPKGRYAVIVADPSWKFRDQLDGSDQARGGLDYPPMELAEILAMRVGETYATEDCALWLWVPNALLIDGTAAKVLEAWGFEGKSLWTWRKVDSKGEPRMGSGHFGRNCTEQVILATRGRPVVNGEDVVNWFDAPRTSRHSEKPALFFDIAAKVTPCAPDARIELFARDKERPGWVTSGAEQQAKVREAHADAREPVIEPKSGGLHETPMEWGPFETKTDEGASLIWREGSNDVLRAAGASGALYTITNSLVAPGFVELVSTDRDDRARLPDRLRAKERADEWERERLGSPPKKGRRLPPLVDVPAPAEPEPREPSTSGSQIEWVDKKHPTIVAVGRGYATRRYEIRREHKRTLQGKKIDGYIYRWFCGQDGSLKDFATIPEVKSDALRAEREWLIASGRAA